MLILEQYKKSPLHFYILPILVYGMTEGLLLTVNVYNRIKEGSVGVLVPGLEGKVHDLNL